MAKPNSSKSKSFESAVDNADYNAIVGFASQHRSKKNPYSFYDELQNIKADDLKKLMKQLLKILMEYMEKNLNQTAAVDWTTLNPEQCRKIGQFIQATTDIGLACLQCNLTSVCRVELVQIAVFLHGLMLSMPVSMDYVKNCIVNYNEKLFFSGFIENAELFLTNVVMHLLRKTLVKRPSKADVKKICNMKSVLRKILAGNGPSTAQLWSLFAECAISHIYLTHPEGLKLIVYVMNLNPDRILGIHEKVKNYIQGIPIKAAKDFGTLYFEAWCYTLHSHDREMRDVIEISCLQQFLLMGIHSKHRNILPIIRKIFAPFYIHKKDPSVSKMLYSMYQPLIWRYLKHPNGLYRASASQLFLDIFPLEDPDMRVVRNDIEVTEQLLLIKDLLVDDFPIVRITVILGICVSMSVNWEVFPEEMLKTYFRIIVNDLSRDSASAEVRVAVVKGLKCLLENPLTIRSLSGVLPKLTGLFHDVSENVRIAFCQLLLKVKKISAIKYFQIVPINHLFARMEEDCHAVKKSLANLLYNSYFPKNQDPKVWLGRCLEIIKTEKTVSRVFFSYVSSFVGIDYAVKFMIQAVKAVHFYVKTKSSSSHIDMEISDKENIRSFTDYIVTLEQAVGFGNLTIVKTLMESIAVMWLSLKPVSDLNVMKPESDSKKIVKMLVGKLSLTLSELCLYYKDTEAWESVFYLSSFLPFSHNPSLSSLCFMRIKNLSPDAQEPDYMTLLECLANQFQMLELLNILKEWIETGLSSSYVPPPAKKRRGRKKTGDGVNHDQSKPYLANRMLNSVLNHRNLQKHALVEQSALLEIVYFSDIVKRKLEKVSARLMSETETDFLNLLIYNIIRISVLLHNHPTYDITSSVPFLNEFLTWTNKKLVKHLYHVDDANNHFILLIYHICQNLSQVLSDVTALGFFEADDCLYLDFMHTLLGTDFGYRFLLIASRFMYKHAASGQLMILMESTPIMMEHHLVYLTKMFVLIYNSESMLGKLSEKEFVEITFTLGNVMQIVHNHINRLTEFTSPVFKTLIKTILDCTAVRCTDLIKEVAEDPFDRLSFPTSSNFFVSIINVKPKLIRIYVKYLTDVLKDSGNIDLPNWIAYWMITWNFLHVKAISQLVVREIHSLVLLLEKQFNDLYPHETDSEENNSQVPSQLFQNHCHSELIKLKNKIRSKLRGSKAILN